MRYTADRQGHKWEESTGQDRSWRSFMEVQRGDVC